MYAIFNGDYFLKQDRGYLVPVKQACNALQWKEQKPAANMVKNLPKHLRGKGYSVVEVPETMKQVQRSEIEAKTPTSAWDKSTSPDQADVFYSRIEQYVESASQLTEIFKACREALVWQERKQLDLLHKLEFESMANGNVAHLGAELRKCRILRRKYKNMLSILSDLYFAQPYKVEKNYMEKKESVLSGRSYQCRTEPNVIIGPKG